MDINNNDCIPLKMSMVVACFLLVWLCYHFPCIKVVPYSKLLTIDLLTP